MPANATVPSTADGATSTLHLARRLHDTVAQRLAAVSLLLATDAPMTPGAHALCQAEVAAALNELHETLASVAGPAPPPGTPVERQLELLRSECPRLALKLPPGGVPAPGDPPLVATFLTEALRNVRKHAEPIDVTISAGRGPGVRTISVTNDGTRPLRGASCGAGMRLLQFEASLAGALVESSALRPGWWRQRLIVPA